MDIRYANNMDLQQYFLDNKDTFEERLLEEAVNVKDKIEDIRLIGNINLLENAHKLVMFVIEERGDELEAFAIQEGKAWARHSLTLAFKLEWVQAIRRTIWVFLEHFENQHKKSVSQAHFFELEKAINQKVDQFLNTFFITYSKYKDELIEAQREMVANLSVPIIPINKEICVLPLIGEIDEGRMIRIEEKVLMEIASLRIQTLMIDMSGVADMDQDVIDRFLKVMDGIEMMGCKAVLTGLHPMIVRKVIQLGVSFGEKAVVKGSLQQALKNYLAN